MLPRSRKLLLKSGDYVETPLLVPALSSKGFAVLKTGQNEISEASKYLDVAAPNLNEALLISAYDIHYRNLEHVELLKSDFYSSIFANPKLLIIDSGGYEHSRIYDLSAPPKTPASPKRWSQKFLDKTLDVLGPSVTGALVNLDQRAPYANQIRQAQAFFAKRPRFIRDVLLKPEPNQHYIDVDGLVPHIRKFLAFDIVGVTEKELGSTLLERATTVARLRRAMDQHEVDKPIHLFGSLDTLYTPLYFLMGAEIFDGLTWMRYSYYAGQTLHFEALPLITGNLTLRDDQRAARVLTSNLDYLLRLKLDMRRYLMTKDMTVFAENAAVLSKGVETVMSHLNLEEK